MSSTTPSCRSSSGGTSSNASGFSHICGGIFAPIARSFRRSDATRVPSGRGSQTGLPDLDACALSCGQPRYAGKAMTTEVVHAVVEDWAAVRKIRLRALADAPDAFASRLADERGRAESEWRAPLLAPGAGTIPAFAHRGPGRPPAGYSRSSQPGGGAP